MTFTREEVQRIFLGKPLIIEGYYEWWVVNGHYFAREQSCSVSVSIHGADEQTPVRAALRQAASAHRASLAVACEIIL